MNIDVNLLLIMFIKSGSFIISLLFTDHQVILQLCNYRLHLEDLQVKHIDLVILVIYYVNKGVHIVAFGVCRSGSLFRYFMPIDAVLL